MLKNWGKLVYPKFLENWEGEVTSNDDTIWKGNCYFSWKSRGKRPKDGTQDNVTARATTDMDIVVKLQPEGELMFKVNEREFMVGAWRPYYNPDGTFHHLTFDLLEV